MGAPLHTHRQQDPVMTTDLDVATNMVLKPGMDARVLLSFLPCGSTCQGAGSRTPWQSRQEVPAAASHEGPSAPLCPGGGSFTTHPGRCRAAMHHCPLEAGVCRAHGQWRRW